MKLMEQIISLLPSAYAAQLQEKDFLNLEELRLGQDRPLRLCYSSLEREIWPATGQAVLQDILMRACHQSIYAYTDTLRQGFVTIEGGHRIGICGFGVQEGADLRTIRDPSSLNVRIARQVKGCAVALLPHLTISTLILGPPGSGKTTLLRDAVRLLSDHCRQRVGLVDERGELSASAGGTPQLQIGGRTDCMINVPKAAATMMLLRTMNPHWIALDEITAPSDLIAMEQAAYCGVLLLATAHGSDTEDLQRRPLYRDLLKTGVFQQVVVLKRDKTYHIEEVGK